MRSTRHTGNRPAVDLSMLTQTRSVSAWTPSFGASAGKRHTPTNTVDSFQHHLHRTLTLLAENLGF